MKEIGIYVHIPFCKKKCKYCDFISFENLEFVDRYVNCVLNDIQNIDNILIENDIGKISDEVVSTIYFGGGTPSLIDSKYIIKILEKINEKFRVKKDAEITIEVNPGTASKEKLKDYYNNSINRLSIGLQSAQNDILKTIGRIHNFEEFLEVYENSRNIGFKNINIDLIEGLPNQSLEDLIFSLKEIINLNPEHISLYSLILEEGTILEKEVKSGILKLPDENLEREMYYESKNILEENGYIHYEISNFAKENFYSKHNMNCWNQEEYLGFGLASHSYFNNIRFSNVKNLQKYIEKNGEQVYNKNVVIHEKQTKEDKMKEYMILGFRKLDGIDFKVFKEKFEIDVLEYFEKEIKNLKNKGLIEISQNRAFLTEKGLDFANIVFEEFI